jgi:predicted phage replisome organizer
MPDIHWVKLSTAMFDDEKIKVIRSMPSGSEICLLWINLIVLAGKTNDNGFIRLSKDLPYTEDMLAKICDQPVEIVRCALEAFVRMDMIERLEPRGIVLVNWEKYQNVDGLDKIREQNRLRKSRQRSNQKLLSRDSHVTCPEEVTPGHALELDSELDIDTEKKEKIAQTRRTESKQAMFYDFTSSLWYGIEDDQVALWQEAYPAVDVELELRQMGEWCKTNGAKGKKQNWGRFIVNWLKRAQDRGGSAPAGGKTWQKKQYSR